MNKEHFEKYNPPVKKPHKGMPNRPVQKRRDKGGLGS